MLPIGETVLSVAVNSLPRPRSARRLSRVTSPAEKPVQLRHPPVLLWRSPTCLQLGTDPSAVELEPVPAAIAEAIRLLAEPHTPTQLAAKLPHLAPEWITWLCAHLGSADLLYSAFPAARHAVVVWGSGRLAERVLARVTEAGVAVRRTSGPVPDRRDDLVVIASQRWEPDRAVLAQLTTARVPHLVVRAEPNKAVVGPFVLPGRTPCVRCDDISRARSDEKWPLLLAQLCGAEGHLDDGLASWAAATATAQVRAWLAGAQPETAGRVLELSSTQFRLHSRSWSFQSRCGCHPQA